ncbi:MAG: protein-ADP-ribose hydrolase [Lachnospiraceae bacterium]|nr:protein-ADP-ribose hydrolase [Lachnospiraceae bacterium]
MNRAEKADVLLEKLKEDSVEYRDLETDGYSPEETKQMIRSLMNVRMPKALSDELIKLQDEYLQEELQKKGIVTLAEIPTIKEQIGGTDYHVGTSFFKGKQPFLAERLSIWQGDITRLKVGAIVNAANSQMLGCFVPCHRCIDNAIHSAAGMQLREECSHIMSRRRLRHGGNYEEPTGTATLTSAYNLPCDYVIHTVGPIVYGGLNQALCQDLRNCYENVLQCCLEHKIRSVAFCCISTGEFHFPNDKAAEIAVKTVTDFLEKNGDCMERIIFNVFKENDYEIYKNILK